MNKDLKIGDNILIETYTTSYGKNNFQLFDHKINCPICNRKYTDVDSHNELKSGQIITCLKCNSKFKFTGFDEYSFSPHYTILEIGKENV